MERKPRNKQQKQLDLLYPIDITKLGSQEDPCFGKHFLPSCSECQRCGDAELCQIVISQKLHTKRGKIEKEGKFKDMEEKEIYDSMPTVLDIKKEVRSIIRRHKKISFDSVVKDVVGKYSSITTEKKVISLIKKMLLKTNKFTQVKQNLIWK